MCGALTGGAWQGIFSARPPDACMLTCAPHWCMLLPRLGVDPYQNHVALDGAASACRGVSVVGNAAVVWWARQCCKHRSVSRHVAIDRRRRDLGAGGGSHWHGGTEANGVGCAAVRYRAGHGRAITVVNRSE